MEAKRNIYNDKWGSIEKETERVAYTDISDENKTLILRYHEYLQAQGIGRKRIVKLSSQARRLCLKTGKDFTALTKADLISIVAGIRGQETTTLYTYGGGVHVKKLSEATKADYIRLLHQLFKWWEDEDPRFKGSAEEREEAVDFYKALKRIKATYKPKQISAADVVTDNDIDSVINLCRSLKERALLKVLHESGARAGEILGVRICDIDVRENRWIMHLNGKTGRRPFPLVSSIPYLVQWLGIHPYRDDPKSLLWTGENVRKMHKPLRYAGLSSLLKRTFARAGLGKKCNPHWMRHSRASLLAPHVSEVILCKLMGWQIGSSQIRCYVHLCNKQVEDAMLEYKGIQKVETRQEQKDQICSRCDMTNPPSGRYCVKCGSALSIAVAAEDQEAMSAEMNKTVHYLMQIAQDPKLLAQFEKFKKQQ